MKRRSDSARAAITARPRAHVALASPPGAARARAASRGCPAIDLIGASELLSSWPSTRIRRCQAWRSSSRSARLTSDSTSSCMRPPALAERAAAHLPAAGAARERQPRRCAAARPSRHAREAELASAPRPSSALGGRAEQALAGAVDEPQLGRSPSKANTATSISSITLRSSAVASSGAEALLAQRLGERVHLEQRPRRARRRAARRAPGSRSPPRAARRAGSRASAAAATTRLARGGGDQASHEITTTAPSVQRVRGCRSLCASSRAGERRAPAAPPPAPAAGRAGRAAGVAASAAVHAAPAALRARSCCSRR